MKCNYKGYVYDLDRDCQATHISLFFAATGKIYTDILDFDYYEYELIEALDRLIAQNEKYQEYEYHEKERYLAYAEERALEKEEANEPEFEERDYRPI